MQVDSAEDGDDDDDDDDNDDEDNDVDDGSDGKDNENDNLIESDEEGQAAAHIIGSGCGSGTAGAAAGACKPHASTSDAAKARDRHADRAAKFSSIWEFLLYRLEFYCESYTQRRKQAVNA